MLAAAAAGLALSCGADAALAAATGDSFGVRPAHFNPANPLTRAYFIRTLRPGASFSDAVIASNSSSRPLRLRVYAVDGLTAKTSGAVYANRTDPRKRAGRWLRPVVSQVTLPPRTEGVVTFKVRAPSSAVPGDHLAGIAFEMTHRPRSKARFSVVEVVREVVGVLVEVPGRAHPRMKLGSVALRPLPGLSRASVVVPIGNLGRKLCKPTLQVALVGPRHYRRTVAARLDTILPGDTIPYPLPWPSGLRPGSYNAKVRAACPGTIAYASSSARLGAALNGPERASSHPSGSSDGGTPAWVFLAIALGGGAAGASVSQLRRRRRQPERSA